MKDVKYNILTSICVAHAVTCWVTALFFIFSGDAGWKFLILILCGALSCFAGYITVRDRWLKLYADSREAIVPGLIGAASIIIPVVIVPEILLVIVTVAIVETIRRKR